MTGDDYGQMVHVLSFDASTVSDAWNTLRSNPSFEATLAEAIRLVCSSEWAEDGNVLNAILCADGTIIGPNEAHEIMASPNFPKIYGRAKAEGRSGPRSASRGMSTMPAGRPLTKLRPNWFIGIQVYGSSGEPTWVVRGPFEDNDGLGRAYAQLAAINMVITEPYQAASIRKAREMCLIQKVARKAS